MKDGFGWSTIGVALAAFCGAVIAGFVIVQFVGLILGLSVVRENAATSRTQPGGGPIRVDVTGWVEEVETVERWIRVSSGFLWLHSTRIAITPETVIVVDQKQGGFGDLRHGIRVNVVYESRDTHHIAKIVRVLTRR